MIPIRRGEEPEALRDERYWRRARAMLAHLEGQGPRDADLTGYDGGRNTLQEAQGHKCAYCEMLLIGGPIEHFRPKSVYFWLTWSWKNLFISCSTCNQTDRKGTRFDLRDPSKKLQPGEEPPGEEEPMLLDPADPAESPVRHIQFVFHAGKWSPRARAGSRRGDATIRTFNLDQGPILDHYQTHVANLEPWIRAVQEAIRIGDAASVADAWKKLLGNAFSKTQQFHGLMYDVIQEELPEGLRARWRLDLPEPGSALPPDPAPRDRVVPAHQGLPERLVLEVCALSNRPTAAARDEVLVKLCAFRPFSSAELAAIIDRPEAYVLKLLKDLQTKGRLTLTGDRYQAAPAPP